MSHRAAIRTGWSIGIVGVVLVAFGAIWMGAIFTRFEKIPDDWEQHDVLQGTFSVVDEQFLGRLLADPTISVLLASEEASSLLSDPAVQGILTSPALLDLLEDQGLMAKKDLVEGLDPSRRVLHPVMLIKAKKCQDIWAKEIELFKALK